LLHNIFQIWPKFPADRSIWRSWLPRQLARHGADRTGAHAQHHVTVAGDIHNRLRHRRDVLDEDRLDLAGDAQGAGKRTAVGGDDGRFAGGVDVGQSQRVDR